MRAVVISGSPRPGAQSRRISHYIQRRVDALYPPSATQLIDLAALPEPGWNGDYKRHPGDDPKSGWQAVMADLKSADAAICVVPEHHGMAPPAFKTFLLTCRYELAHKPALLVGVSASDGGAYPLAELRSSAAKNNRICWIPEQVIARQAKQVLLDDDMTNGAAADFHLKQRLDYALRLLAAYADGLRLVRESNVVDHSRYAFGM